jgi:hypothetical protein
VRGFTIGDLMAAPGRGPTQNGTFNFVVKGTDSGNPAQTATANDFIVIRAGLGRNDSIATATPLGNSQNGANPIVFSISPYIDPKDSALDFKAPGAANTNTTFYVHVFDWRGDARPDMLLPEHQRCNRAFADRAYHPWAGRDARRRLPAAIHHHGWNRQRYVDAQRRSTASGLVPCVVGTA